MRATLRWASGRSPRNVTFQSARPPDKATGRRDKVLELLLFKKSSHLSKFSATPTLLNKIDESSKLLRWVPRWDGHPAGVLEFLLFNRLGRWTTGRRLFIVYWLHSVFLRNNFRTWQCIHNVSMIKMNITHEIVNQSQFSRLKIRTFRHENLCVLNTLQSHFPSLKTIISSRSPPHKVSNYVKNVPMWT